MAQKRIKVKDCDRCGGTRKPATITRKFAVDKDQYEIDLCDDHARAFDRDMGAWARIARDITPVVYRFSSEMKRERDIDRAVKSAFKPTPPDDPNVVVIQRLPASFHLWSLTDHAKQRCRERQISEHDALMTACDPGYAFPARSDAPNTFVHIRGEWAAVVNPIRKVVITVMTRAAVEAEEKEAHHAR